MIPSKNLKILGPPGDRFITTYGSDFKPLKERSKPKTYGPQNHGTEAKNDPTCLNLPHVPRENWPVFNHYIYKTTNSTYGSGGCPQPPSYSIFPAYLAPFAVLAPNVPQPCGGVGSVPTQARAQDVGLAYQTLPGEQERGRLHYIFGRKGNPLDQQEARDAPQKNIDILYEEGLIVLSALVSPPGCEDIRSVCNEAGLQRLLPPNVASAPIITMNDAENWDSNAYLGSLRSALGLRDNNYLPPTSTQCSGNCDRETEVPESCRFRMLTGIPGYNSPPLAREQPTFNCTGPVIKPQMTEYQSSFAAEWTRPDAQLSYFNQRPAPRHQMLYLPI